ncbi:MULTISPECIES: 4-hydroxybenzoate octaprenyltransferase [unclassified Candidatus Tisiphia]|uniref:4-hydroxybenzoate octaprenyltransferase n=2 Tax=Candidatus Tisiphia TaxID=2996317 RepID=UPI001E6E644E|nr:MAG: 4-hydroxybenzoate octaprenyltransferase [Rickettsia endosymbiont of Cimex lectularius]
MAMPNKFFLSLKLMRLQSPTGYLLLFFSTCFGVLLTNIAIYNLVKLLSLFFIGSIITRGAGCVLNDIFDKDFDKHVLRTKDRPLANGSLNVNEAMILLTILSVCSLTILLSLNKTAICLGFLSFIMIVLYPLMKRMINFPQVFLGLTFNGVLIGSSAVIDKISIESGIMYIACCFWIIGYDTIYGFMDIKDDKKIKIKSMPLFLEKRNYKLHLYVYYTIFILLFIFANIIATHRPNYIAILCAYIMLIWQVVTLEISDPQNCLTRFKNNNYVGLILALGALDLNN